MNYAPHIPPTNMTGTPVFVNISIEDVTSTSSVEGWLLDGLPESQIHELSLKNVSLSGITKKDVVGCDNIDAATSTCDKLSVLPSCPSCVPSTA